MELKLPPLDATKLSGTRDYLQNVAKVLGKFQQAFAPTEPHDWQYGLEPTEIGLAVKPMRVDEEDFQLELDMQAGVVRIGRIEWSLEEYAAPELLHNLQVWLQSQSVVEVIKTPDFSHSSQFDLEQSRALGTAFWQLAGYFKTLNSKLTDGLVSPILVYPHHLDLSAIWYPFNDDQQLSVGFSTGDDNVHEPYLYLTASPEPAAFTELELPNGAFWQQSGFSGAILPYAELRSHHQPARLLKAFAADTLQAAKPLFT